MYFKRKEPQECQLEQWLVATGPTRYPTGKAKKALGIKNKKKNCQNKRTEPQRYR